MSPIPDFLRRTSDAYKIPQAPLSATPEGTALPAPETFNKTLVWRVISHRYRHGHWEYLYADYVLADHINEYMSILGERGALRVNFDRIGTYDEILRGSIQRKEVRGAGSVLKEKSNHRLEDYLGQPIQ